MNIQIIKIIPCLLAGFILSACVGAVNLAEGAVKNTKSNTETEEEPIVVDPQVALINRCTTKDLATDASCAPIVADHPCIEDPFGGACDITFTDYYKTAQANRISFCRENPKHDLCISAVKNVCDKNPFDGLCGNNFINTRNAIIGRCRTDNTDNFCPQAIASVCGADSLDTLCNGLTAYFPAQYAACENDNTNRRCNPTIARVCGADSLDVLCAGKTTYFPVQKTACKDKQNPDQCAPIIAGICKADSLDMICNGLTAYLPAQKRVCRYINPDPRCESIIMRVCGADIFDSLCNTIESYHPEQKRICESEPNSDRCAPTIDRVCKMDMFGSLCQKSYLKTRNLPTRPSNSFKSINGDLLSANCGFNDSYSNRGLEKDYRCHVFIPNVINIKPLNDANTGTATYAGSVSIRGWNTGRIITEDIDIIVDFDNNTLSYSGNVDSSSNPFRITGNFTDRGLIGGTVRFRASNAPLIGLIGQDEAIGVFATIEGTHFRSSYAGGFIATRE